MAKAGVALVGATVRLVVGVPLVVLVAAIVVVDVAIALAEASVPALALVVVVEKVPPASSTVVGGIVLDSEAGLLGPVGSGEAVVEDTFVPWLVWSSPAPMSSGPPA